MSEIFRSLQMEGPNTGVPSLFVRFAGCNMIPVCPWCDTKYALNTKHEIMNINKVIKIDRTGYLKYTPEEIVDMIKKQNLTNIVLTGGEPLAQNKNELYKLLDLLYAECMYTVEIETNGLVYLPSMSDKLRDLCAYMNIQYNISPKKQCYDMNVLKKYRYGSNSKYIFKFVIENKKDFDFWRNKVIGPLNIPNEKVYLMPEGTSSNKIIDGCKELVNKYCVHYNYNLSARLHVILWNNERGR